MKKLAAALVIFFAVVSIVTMRVEVKTVKNSSNNDTSYGAFVGLQPKNINKLLSYKEVVIDASYYNKAQIDFLHKKGIKVYSYLNIGSLEKFRPYYGDFQNITLGEYDNWQDERWINVGNIQWDKYVINVLGKDLKDKGIDGFFLDNLDVYSKYKEESIFEGLLNIIQELNSNYKLPIIANNGEDFFEAAESKNLSIKKLVHGVNMENVYTSVDFNNNKFVKNSSSDREESIKYLKKLKAKGIEIYIIEYAKDYSLRKDINTYYDNLGFKVYISKSLSLK